MNDKRRFWNLHKDVVFGRAGGKIIWQPRIGCWYDDKMFSGEGLPQPYTGMNIHEVYRELNCSARLYEYNSCFVRDEHPEVYVKTNQLNETDFEHTIHTPVGKQVFVHRKSANSQHIITVKWEIETEEEMKVAQWREENSRWRFDYEQYAHLEEELGDLGAPTMFMPRMNVQALYIEKMGVQNAVYALYGRPDKVESYFAALERNHDQLIEVINECPIEIINFGENIHSGTLSPDLFLKYHLPACQRRCEKLHQAGKFVSAHWDGDTKPLLQYARETGLDAIEAITPQPQGDVSLDEIKAGLGDQVFLMDGIPAIYFDDTYSEQVLIDCVYELIEKFAPRLVLGISDEISSTGDIERVKIVRDIVDKYNAEEEIK